MAGIELTSDPSCTATTEAVNDESLRPTGMHPRLLEACRSGNCGLFDFLYDQLVGPDILKDKTPYGNTALHLAVMLGHYTFAGKVLFREPSLLTSLNNDRETPLIGALMAGNSSLARTLIAAAAVLPAASSREPPDHDLERRLPRNHLCEMLEMTDLCGQNALHHALRSMPDRDVALHILHKVRDHQETAVRLSCQVSKNGESPMHIACQRGYPDVVEELLAIPESSDEGPANTTAMHSAVVAQQIGIVNKLLKKRPHLASRLCNGHTPLTLAVAIDNLQMVETFMRHDPSLAYINCGAWSSEAEEEEEEDNDSHECMHSPFILAVSLGRVEIAKEIATRCPDSAYYRNGTNRVNALHRAIEKEHPKMVTYLLSTPRFRRLINQADLSGKLPLHCAAGMCNAELLRPLLKHEAQDCTTVTADNKSAVDLVYSRKDLYNTRKWNDAYALLSHQICFHASDHSEHRAKKKMMNLSHVQQEQKKTGYLMLHDKYTKNASLVAILIITITFIAVFSTVSVSAAGYSSVANYNGLATKQVPFKVFLVTYTIAMLSSLAVCFTATYIREEYKALARMLLGFAYVTTTVAFVSGLYLVSPTSLWPVLVTVITVVLICTVAILVRFRFNISGILPWLVSQCFSPLPSFLPPRY